VYARSTTFHGKPANVDAGIRFLENEAGPMLASTEGCLGVSLLIDRDSGQCIVTSSWRDAPSREDSFDTLRPLRDRGRDILGGPMQVDDWEIASMHRTHHGETCRVSWIEGDLDAMIETFRIAILPSLEQTSGFCSASMLVNRTDGLACVTTAWETHKAMEASREAADQMRARVAEESDGTVVEVHEFDLAYAHLHVPEMA
jgi:hypothetical protein